jgi:hypothetical protein
MPISVQCSCGKKMGLADALAGKTVRCPSCGASILATAPQAPVGKSAKSATKKSKASPAVYVSTGKIIAAAAVLLVLICSILFYIGPMRNWNKWETMDGPARDTVVNVVTFALQAYMSTNGLYDPSKSHQAPDVEPDDFMFYRPLMSMSMPEKVKFQGKSNEGDFTGFYDTQTGDIEADVSYGGYSLAGQVDISKPLGTFHMTGRMVNSQPQAEVDGQPLHIVYPAAQ